MAYEYKTHKVVAVLAANLEAGVALNVIGHMAISIGAYADQEMMGRSELLDASGTRHKGIAKYPVIITKVKPGRLRQLIQEARQEDGLLLVDYPEQMLHTGHDDELAEQLSLAKEETINYLGAMLYGKAEALTRLTGNFMLWK